MKTFTHIVLATGLAGVLLTPSAQAASPQATTFEVSLTLINSCTIAVGNLSFGTTVETLANAINATAATATVTCTGIGIYTIALNAGDGLNSTVDNRKMDDVAGVGGTNTIAYNLYTTSGGNIVIGDGTAGTVMLGGTSLLGTGSHFIYGRVTAAQNPKPVGTYSSTVTATVTF